MLSDTSNNNLSLSVAKTTFLLDNFDSVHLSGRITLQPILPVLAEALSLNAGPILKIDAPISQ